MSNDREVSDYKLDADLRAARTNGFARYVPCPMLYCPGPVVLMPTGAILGVWCKPDEEIVWTWYDDRVVGYSIVKHGEVLQVRDEGNIMDSFEDTE